MGGYSLPPFQKLILYVNFIIISSFFYVVFFLLADIIVCQHYRGVCWIGSTGDPFSPELRSTRSPATRGIAQIDACERIKGEFTTRRHENWSIYAKLTSQALKRCCFASVKRVNPMRK